MNGEWRALQLPLHLTCTSTLPCNVRRDKIATK